MYVEMISAHITLSQPGKEPAEAPTLHSQVHREAWKLSGGLLVERSDDSGPERTVSNGR